LDDPAEITGAKIGQTPYEGNSYQAIGTKKKHEKTGNGREKKLHLIAAAAETPAARPGLPT
jgi:hypothetical protein